MLLDCQTWWVGVETFFSELITQGGYLFVPILVEQIVSSKVVYRELSRLSPLDFLFGGWI